MPNIRAGPRLLSQSPLSSGQHQDEGSCPCEHGGRNERVGAPTIRRTRQGRADELPASRLGDEPRDRAARIDNPHGATEQHEPNKPPSANSKEDRERDNHKCAIPENVAHVCGVPRRGPRLEWVLPCLPRDVPDDWGHDRGSEQKRGGEPECAVSPSFSPCVREHRSIAVTRLATVRHEDKAPRCRARNGPEVEHIGTMILTAAVQTINPSTSAGFPIRLEARLCPVDAGRARLRTATVPEAFSTETRRNTSYFTWMMPGDRKSRPHEPSNEDRRANHAGGQQTHVRRKTSRQTLLVRQHVLEDSRISSPMVASRSGSSIGSCDSQKCDTPTGPLVLAVPRWAG